MWNWFDYFAAGVVSMYIGFIVFCAMYDDFCWIADGLKKVVKRLKA